ncbi:uncharacterized protein LOC117643875 [Thrips palmi]|uniref:Uncharacterized protein LOC117643875 n=1 Tax=Thrips palmi TaxID=161013 RepID=A0A6P8YXG3_THRPL|nr:uncharacterized protein LOC117643875 [Thrips palmi]
MSRAVQRGASTAMRMRSMSSGPVPEVKLNFSPEKLAEMGRAINPGQTAFGPKNANIEKWQKHFQDPLNAETPMYRRKGVSDDLIVSGLSISVASLFVYNVINFFTD